MATKKKEPIIAKKEQLSLKFYAVQNKDGKWFKNKGFYSYEGTRQWVDTIDKAKIYVKPGPAKSVITFWAKRYPEYGVPFLVEINIGECIFYDIADETIKNYKKKAIADCKKNISYIESRIAYYSLGVLSTDITWHQKRLDDAKLELEKLLTEK